jgi:ligand-binding sensor domain-containing protein
LLIGTIDGGFYQFKRSEKAFVKLDVNGTIEKAKGITTFEKGKGNNIWVGTRDGLFNYDLKLKKLKRFQQDQTGREFSKGEVSAIH